MSQLTDQLKTARLEATPPTSGPLVLSLPAHITRALPAYDRVLRSGNPGYS